MPDGSGVPLPASPDEVPTLQEAGYTTVAGTVAEEILGVGEGMADLASTAVDTVMAATVSTLEVAAEATTAAVAAVADMDPGNATWWQYAAGVGSVAGMGLGLFLTAWHIKYGDCN